MLLANLVDSLLITIEDNPLPILAAGTTSGVVAAGPFLIRRIAPQSLPVSCAAPLSVPLRRANCVMALLVKAASRSKTVARPALCKPESHRRDADIK